MKRSILAFLATVLMFSLACSFFDDDVTNVTYETGVPFDINVSADALCPPSEDCTGEVGTAPQEAELLPIEFDVQIDVVEATGRSELAQYAGNFRSVEITSIEYVVSDNDLNFALPPTTIFVGPQGATSTTGPGVVELATIPAVPAGTNPTGAAPVEDANRSAAGEEFKKLKFSAIPFSQPVIAEGEPFPPRGTARMQVKVNLKLEANPADAL
ncbi:MAG: hypothetical protein ACNA8W_20430 [Bradymonadaceae bacterium]